MKKWCQTCQIIDGIRKRCPDRAPEPACSHDRRRLHATRHRTCRWAATTRWRSPAPPGSQSWGWVRRNMEGDMRLWGGTGGGVMNGPPRAPRRSVPGMRWPHLRSSGTVPSYKHGCIPPVNMEVDPAHRCTPCRGRAPPVALPARAGPLSRATRRERDRLRPMADDLVDLFRLI